MNNKMKKVAIVTGGAQGIGLAITNMFLLKHKFSIAICGRTGAAVQKAEKQLQEILKDRPGPEIYCEVLDIGTSGNARGFVERAATALGGIDVLVNNAAHV